MAQIVKVKLSELKETEHNPRQITGEDFEKLKKSLQEDPEFLEAREVVVDENFTILGGHQRIKALRAMGVKEIEVKQVTGWSEEKKRRFVIKDNLQSGDWDIDELANAWDDLPLEDWGLPLSKWENQTEYQDFVDKFKPKLTTDDCYTPPAVMEAVEKWARKEYGISDDVPNIRPFKPEGDYQKEDYTGKVVIDNPPFSILAEIVRWFSERDIKFFLFTNHLTLLGNAHDVPMTRVLVGAAITYENGAKVNTSFVTNMDSPEVLVHCSASLAKAIEEAQPDETKDLERYDRPENCKMVTDLIYTVKARKDTRLTNRDLVFVKNLDELKAQNKGLYGGGILVSDKIAKQLAEDKASAKQLAEDKARIKVGLSPKEQEIVDILNGD